MDYLPPPAFHAPAPPVPAIADFLVAPPSGQDTLESPAMEPESPLLRPSTGFLVQGFTPDNIGLNFAGMVGDPIKAAAPGRVLFAGPYQGPAMLVILRHEGDLITTYSYASHVFVRTGDLVERGQIIAEMGANEQGEIFLHFRVKAPNGKFIDPAPFLDPIP